ncbi:hypothetical protein [Pseudalkalibacillus salsuginis]|uniref:hypothetical protein n=1 Tax=Pseudalkalibacillus salsuginis TaxID=2910972 RepID=UPI001F3E7C40|nr:hypothetical protein [Pseudalkalibacillus salsuginis]MCF6409991.1 hypothetical protein [Pseudalkalibacillus salsuginis]
MRKSNEEKLLSFFNEEPSESYDRMGAAQAWGHQTKTFVLDLKEYYPKNLAILT